jgi:GNAT superfamily N-acetyltransferase
MQIEALNSDKDRAAVETFFAAHISEEQARVPVLPRANDPHRGHRSHIFAIREGGDIIAALYAAPPVLEVAEMTMVRGIPASIGESALAEFVMLYDVATAPHRRGEGHAGALVEELERRVWSTSAHTIYGVCSADSAHFYRSRGYGVLPPDATLETKWANVPVRFAIEGDAQWFTKSVVGRGD